MPDGWEDAVRDRYRDGATLNRRSLVTSRR